MVAAKAPYTRIFKQTIVIFSYLNSDRNRDYDPACKKFSKGKSPAQFLPAIVLITQA
tara:strand:+ start:1355 stop:1525 length:171 start_codon:yes stop_codon:yes gene_type:complete